MGDKLVSILIAVYGVLSLVYLFEGKGWKALYWLGAALITISVRKMQ